MHGITIPSDIAVFYQNVYFKITQNSGSIILTSGMKVTTEDAKKMDWNEVAV